MVKRKMRKAAASSLACFIRVPSCVIRAFVLQCARFSVMFMMTSFAAMTFVVAAFSGCCCLVFAIGSIVYAFHKTP